MAYYFMVEKKKGEYQALNIENVAGFHGERKYTKNCAYTLQEIDMFTMLFSDEEELRRTLIDYGVLSLEMSRKPLSTRWVNKGVYNKVAYDFLYQNDMDYVLEPAKLVEVIMTKFYKKDFVFLKRFANCFASHRECSTTAPEVRMYAEMSIRDGECCKFFDVVDKNGDNQVKRLIKLLLFEYQEQSDGYIYYKNKINYRNLHMMIAFINNYNMQYGISSLKKKEQPRINDGVPSVFYHDSVKPKKKVKILPGQLSIFDEDGDN